jgi:hypothetical protein
LHFHRHFDGIAGMFPAAKSWRCAAVLAALFASTAHAISPLSIRLEVESQGEDVIVRINSTPGELNRLEVSEDLANWRVASVMFNATGVVEFISQAHSAEAQFFRATVAPPETQLTLLSIPPAVGEASAGFVPITESGGAVTRGAVVADFKTGEVGWDWPA